MKSQYCDPWDITGYEEREERERDRQDDLFDRYKEGLIPEEKKDEGKRDREG